MEVRAGKVELGQGILTALAQMAAEELDIDVKRLRMTAATTDLSPDEGLTAGSLSIQHSGAAVREVCAEARDVYLAAAAEKLCFPKEVLRRRGRPDHRSRRDGYQLLGVDRRNTAGPAGQR